MKAHRVSERRKYHTGSAGPVLIAAILVSGCVEKPTKPPDLDLHALSPLEVFDPGTNTWLQLNPMPTLRDVAASAVVDGIFYVLGGQEFLGNAHRFLPTIEGYKSDSDIWIEKNPMLTARGWSSTAVVDGKIYLFGGASLENLNGLNTVEAYDPFDESWVTKAPMLTVRYGVAAVFINDKIYVVGGTVSDPGPRDIDILEIYDPVLDYWVTGRSMPTARGEAVAGVINGKLYVAGGYTPINEAPYYRACDVLEIYDPASNLWTTGASMPTPRGEAVSGVINGKLYVAGGLLINKDATNVLEIYDPGTDTWTTGPVMPTRRAEAASGVINGKLYIAGGY